MPFSNSKLISENDIEGILINDVAVTKKLYEKWIPEIRKVLKSRIAEQSVENEIFEKAYFRIRSKIMKRETIINYDAILKKIFNDFAIDYIRKIIAERESVIKYMRSLGTNNPITPPIDEDYIRTEKNIYIFKTISKMKKPCDTILELFFQDYRDREIADKLNIIGIEMTKNAVTQKRLDCNKKLFDILKNQGEYLKYFKKL